MDTALESIKLIPEQCKQAYEEAKKIVLPEEYKHVKNIAIAGMGGSIYAFYAIDCLFRDVLPVPMTKINTYGIPKSVGPDTLFIASSYSGTTEEVIYNLTEAQKAGAKTVAVSMGGKTIALQQEKGLPFYQFDPKNNPSGQPRMGQGYMLFSMMAILETLGLIPAIDMAVLEEVAALVPEMVQKTPEEAKAFIDTEPFIVAAEHLSGCAHIMRNQTNETAKSYADYNLIPELNHHLMEGLKHPKDKKMQFIFIDSALYRPRIRERFTITKEVVEKQGIPTRTYMPKSTTKLGQFVEVLMWGGYLTYFLAKDYNENANAIPWVDYFKEKLGPLPIEV